MTLIAGCDKIEKPYMEEVNQCGDADAPIPIRQILIEKFTGHKCGNCPNADEKLHELEAIYCDHIIPVDIHAGYFAQPNSSGMYSYDFTTSTGNELNEYFGASEAGLPNALVNRKEYNQSLILGPDTWAAAISDILEEAPKADINVEAGVPENSREASVYVDVSFIEQLEGSIHLTLYLLEDSIVTWQKDYDATPEDVENYPHNNVLRMAINGTWGQEIISGIVNEGQIVNKEFHFTVDEEWKINQCKIVAYIYDESTKQVIQAARTELMYNQ
jgi:hypothetical protein